MRHRTLNLIYEGQYKNNRWEGYGRRIFVEGYYYVGMFSDGRPCGYGTEYRPDNSVIFQGKWKDGVPEGMPFNKYHNTKYRRKTAEGKLALAALGTENLINYLH